MSSSDACNPQQLQMFMPAKHLIDLPFHEPDREWIESEGEEWIDSEGESSWEGGGDYLEDDDQFWDRKLDESYTRGYDYVRDAIQESGQVKVPVKLTTEDYSLGTMQRVRQGHHRIAAANEVNPDMEIPVRHIEDWGQRIDNDPQPNE